MKAEEKRKQVIPRYTRATDGTEINIILTHFMCIIPLPEHL